MARLIPDFIHKDAPPGEKQIFSTLRNSRRGSDWIVLHSLNLPRHLRQNAGEIDFLILVPGKGILILEVKSHQRIRREKGLWYLGNDPPTQRGPFEQASLAMHSLKNDLGNNLVGVFLLLTQWRSPAFASTKHQPSGSHGKSLISARWMVSIFTKR